MSGNAGWKKSSVLTFSFLVGLPVLFRYNACVYAVRW